MHGMFTTEGLFIIRIDLFAYGRGRFVRRAAAIAGKSFLLNRIIQGLRWKHGTAFSSKVAVTAATGIAATHIGGVTLHSFAGCGVPQTVRDFDKMWGTEPRKRWRFVVAPYLSTHQHVLASQML